MLNNNVEFNKEETLNLRSAVPSKETFCEDISEYVAQLQLHMALQARNLVPTLTKTQNSREQLLHETQAIVEKIASRQII